MKISKQKLESLILEEIKSLQEGSPFEEKAKEAQNAWLASRPWTANALEVIRNSKSAPYVDDVPSTLLRFIEGGEKNIPEKDKAAWHALGSNPKYNDDWIRGGLQGDNGGKILKIINDAFEISKTIPLKPFVDGNAKVTPRENPLSMDPLKSPPQLATDDDGYKYITFATENGSWVVIETPPTLNRDQPGIAIGKAPAGQGLAENKMKLTKQQLKHIIKEEIGNLLEFEGWESAYPDIPEEDLDTVPNMIYRFMKGGENVIDTQYTDWMQDARDPATLSLPEDAEYIIAVIKDAFATQEKGRARGDKPGRLTGQIRLENNPDTDQPIISFRVEGVQLGPNPRNLHRGGLFNVVNSKNGGIEIIKR